MNPYQPSSPEIHPEQVRPDFRVMWLGPWQKAYIAGAAVFLLLAGAFLILEDVWFDVGSFWIGCGTLFFSVVFFWLAYGVPRRAARRLRLLSPVHTGEAVCGGGVTWHPAKNRMKPAILLLTPSELILFRGHFRNWKDEHVSRYSLREVVVPSLVVPSLSRGRIWFTEPGGEQIMLRLPGRAAWVKAIHSQAHRE